MIGIQDSQPRILLIEMDDETRPILTHNLNVHGYSVTVALDRDDAIERVRDGRTHIDIILLNQVDLSIESFVKMGAYIRQTANLPLLTPIVVIAEHFSDELEGIDVKVDENTYVTYLRDAQQLLDLLQQLRRN